MNAIGIAMMIIFAFLDLVETNSEKDKNAITIHSAQEMKTAFLASAVNKVEEKNVVGILTAHIQTAFLALVVNKVEDKNAQNMMTALEL